MLEYPKTLKDISKGCKYPLPVIVDSSRGNDEQCEHDSQDIQYTAPLHYMVICVPVPLTHIAAISMRNTVMKI